MLEGIGSGLFIAAAVVLVVNAMLGVLAGRIANYEKLDRGE